MLGKRLFGTLLCMYRKFSTKSRAKVTNGPKIKQLRDHPGTRTEWTDQQKQIIHAIHGHKSVFITGSAGTGKTFLLKHIIKLLRKQYRPSQVFVTASTGVAACALRGQTLHSFSGTGFHMADRETLLNRVLSDKKARSRLKRAKALVIDEISMIDAELFEKLEYVARNIREVDSVWGGIQLVVSGDFFQLPPVKSKGYLYNSSDNDKEFAFEADCWNSSFHLQVELEEVHRQSDPLFIRLLQGIRRGKFGPEELEYLQQFHSSITPDSSVVPVHIYPKNQDVKRVNEERMKSLNNELFVYTALDSDIEARRKFEGIVPYELALCLDARVMLTKNLNPWRKLVNGATGTIVGFSKINDVDEELYTVEDEEEEMDTDEVIDTGMDVTMICQDELLPIVKFDFGKTLVIKPAKWVVKEGDKIVAERKQIPLALAWAVSIHKCQGMTLDCLKTDLSAVFEYGMAYVAISRVRSLEGLHLSGLDPSKIKAHPKVERFYESY